jgi:hypothetical protein
MFELVGLLSVILAALGTSYVALAAILKGIEMLDPRPV